MTLNEKIDDLRERVVRTEERTKNTYNNVKELRKDFKHSDFNPLWLRVMIVVNGVICFWLSALTYLLVKRGV